MAPGALQYGATTADALYLTLGLVAACGLGSPEWPARAAGAAAPAGAPLFPGALAAGGARGRLLLRVVAARGGRLGGHPPVAPGRSPAGARDGRALRPRGRRAVRR